MLNLRPVGIDALRKAVRIAGGMTKLPVRLGVGQSAVSNWIARGCVSAERCRDIETVTDGRVRRYELRPDILGNPWRLERDGHVGGDVQRTIAAS